MKMYKSVFAAAFLSAVLLAGCAEKPEDAPVINVETTTTVATTTEVPTTTTTTEAPTTTTTKKKVTTTKKKTTTTKKKTTTKKVTTTTAKPTTTKKATITTTKATTTTVKPTTTTTAAPTTTTTTAPKPKTYGLNETWVCDAGFEFTITKVERHFICDSDYDEMNTDKAVLIYYTYKNNGFETKFCIDRWDFEVYDAQSVEGEALYLPIYCDHGTGTDAKAVLNGGTGKAVLPVAVENDGNEITVLMEKDGNEAMFVVPVVDPPKPEEEKPEDKWEGCTFTLDTTLPATYSYYIGSGINQKTQSSCSLTEVRFEVSGDDLKIYFTGKKTYDSRGAGQSDSCKISWKLYEDETNTVIGSGTAYTLSVAEGEGFRDCEDTAYDCIEPGKSYTIKLLNTN